MIHGECDLQTERHLNAYVGPRNLKIGCPEPGTVRHDKFSDRDRIHDHSVAVLVEQEWLAVHEVVRRNRERSDFRKGNLVNGKPLLRLSDEIVSVATSERASSISTPSEVRLFARTMTFVERAICIPT